MSRFRGYGRSNLPSGILSNHDDVYGLLKFLQIEQAYVLGASLGGSVALDFTLSYPKCVKALILAAPGVSGHEPSERIKQFGDEEEEALGKGDLEAATELNLRMWVDGLRPPGMQVDPMVRKKVSEMQLRAFAIPSPESLEVKRLSPPAITRLGEINAPALIISGELDLEEMHDLANKVVAEIPNAKQIIIRDAAHMMNMEKPAEFNEAVLNFLNKLS